MSDSQWNPLNLCPDNDKLGTLICIAEDECGEIRGYSVHCLSVLVYTSAVSWYFISRYINKNIYEILDYTKV